MLVNFRPCTEKSRMCFLRYTHVNFDDEDSDTQQILWYNNFRELEVYILT